MFIGKQLQELLRNSLLVYKPIRYDIREGLNTHERRSENLKTRE
jgi:hypothetical protein